MIKIYESIWGYVIGIFGIISWEIRFISCLFRPASDLNFKPETMLCLPFVIHTASSLSVYIYIYINIYIYIYIAYTYTYIS